MSRADKIVTIALLNILKKKNLNISRDRYTGIFLGIQKYLLLKIGIFLVFLLKKFFFWNNQLVSAKVLTDYHKYVNQ